MSEFTEWITFGSILKAIYFTDSFINLNTQNFLDFANVVIFLLGSAKFMI